MKKNNQRPERQSGVALVTTVIVIAVLAVVAVAFMQSASTDRLSSRTVANYHQAQLAAEAGLADAMALLQQSIQDFNYISGAEPTGNSYRTYVRPRKVDGGRWVSGGGAVYLDSGSAGDMAEIGVLGPEDRPTIKVSAGYKDLPDSDDPSAQRRYAFWVDEDGSKQSLDLWDKQAPAAGYVDNVAALPMLLPPEGVGETSAMPAGVVDGLRRDTSRTPRSVRTNAGGAELTLNLLDVRSSLPSVVSANLLDQASGGRISRYFFSRRNLSSAIAPNGRPKMNLRAFQIYLNERVANSAQGAGSAKAELVEVLLTDSPPEAASWGGGTLSWLTNMSARYSSAQQRQIVANIIDYLDDDLIPTTDSINTPTYFGVEMKLDSDGNVMGHPFINFVTPGLVFNRSASATNFGFINTTRILASIGVIYPWPSLRSSTASYTPEIQIQMVCVESQVQNGLDGLSAAADYFSDSLVEQLNRQPRDQFLPFSGENFPAKDGIRATNNYSSRPYGYNEGLNIRDWPQRAPADISFPNLHFNILSLRLKHMPTSGGEEYYVQILPPNMMVKLEPGDISPGGGPGSFIVKFSDAAYNQTKNQYLSADPRAHFLSASWRSYRSDADYTTNIPTPLGDQGQPIEFDISAGRDANEWDGPQGLPLAFNWYTALAVTNYISRSPFDDSAIRSIGELGYIWTGKEWQTLSLVPTNSPSLPDWTLLDYVEAGWIDPADNVQSVKPLSLLASGEKGSVLNSLVYQGGFNVNTRKSVTAAAATFNGEALGLAADASDTLSRKPPVDRASVYGVLGEMTDLLADPLTDKKFARESLVRVLGDLVVGQSRIFTVYSKGQFRKGGALAEATLEADIFVGVNSDTGGPEIQVINKMFR